MTTTCPTCTAVRAALGEHCALTTADGETIEIEPAEAIGYLLHALGAESRAKRIDDDTLAWAGLRARVGLGIEGKLSPKQSAAVFRECAAVLGFDEYGEPAQEAQEPAAPSRTVLDTILPGHTPEQETRLARALAERDSLQPHQLVSILRITSAQAMFALASMTAFGFGTLHNIMRCRACGEDGDVVPHPAPADWTCFACEAQAGEVADLYFVPTRPTATTKETP